jgi:hypothetical protein
VPSGHLTEAVGNQVAFPHVIVINNRVHASGSGRSV